MRTLLVATSGALFFLVACQSSKPESAPAGASPAAAKPTAPMGKPLVELVTSKGTIELELYPDKAPVGVKNMLSYIEKRHYDGTVFHRVIPNFMIQGGGFNADMVEKPTESPIKNEAGNGLLNERGTLAYARRPIPDSATCQFFINLKHNVALDHRDDTGPGFGYAVFGKVVKGMEAVDAIAAVPTGSKGPHQNVPVDPVVIQTARVKSQ
jgi:peptidyl-prolyl cis-trans isomerase B (cyclophilin B)